MKDRDKRRKIIKQVYYKLNAGNDEKVDKFNKMMDEVKSELDEEEKESLGQIKLETTQGFVWIKKEEWDAYQKWKEDKRDIFNM